MPQPRLEEQAPTLTIARDDVLWRLQRRIGLIPEGGSGGLRRAVFFALVGWLPIAMWAWYTGRAWGPQADERLLGHFGITVRCLVAVPLFVLAENVAEGVLGRLVPWFVRSGAVREADLDRWRELLVSIARLRTAARPWVVISSTILAWTLASVAMERSHDLAWAAEGAGIGFGGWWTLLVARPIYLTLLLAWVWRLTLLLIFFRRLSAFDLALVPTHADRLGGLGFVEKMPPAFALVAFAMSVVFASRLAHEVVYHGVHVNDLHLQMGTFLVVVVALFAAPYLLLAPVLRRTKRTALLEYGRLVSEHGRLVGRRWIAHEAVGEEPVLNAPELGPVADVLVLYEAVAAMRTVPLGKESLGVLAVAVALPIAAVLSIEIPVRDLLLGIVKAIA